MSGAGLQFVHRATRCRASSSLNSVLRQEMCGPAILVSIIALPLISLRIYAVSFLKFDIGIEADDIDSDGHTSQADL